MQARADVRQAAPRSGNIVKVTTEDAAPPWEQLRGNLRAFIGRRVQNDADVDDLVQRVLLQIVNNIGSLRDSERLHAWVYRTARNAIVDHYRSSSARREITSGDALDLASTEHAANETPPDDERIALRELAACMTPMMARLPDVYRDALTLTDLEGLNQAEAARRVGVSVSGMKSRVQRGRRHLKTVLEECCRVELDRRGTIVDYTSRKAGGCGCNECK